MEELEIDIKDVQLINVLQLCDAVMSIWTEMSEEVSQNKLETMTSADTWGWSDISGYSAELHHLLKKTVKTKTLTYFLGTSTSSSEENEKTKQSHVGETDIYEYLIKFKM